MVHMNNFLIYFEFWGLILLVSVPALLVVVFTTVFVITQMLVLVDPQGLLFFCSACSRATLCILSCLYLRYTEAYCFERIFAVDLVFLIFEHFYWCYELLLCTKILVGWKHLPCHVFSNCQDCCRGKDLSRMILIVISNQWWNFGLFLCVFSDTFCASS